MTTGAEPWPADGPKLNPDEPEPRSGARLNQPWRAALAGLELIAAIALVLFALWAWQRGVVTIHLPGPDGSREVVTRSVGSWLTGAVGAVTLGGLLVIDAIRQLVLAFRARGRADEG
ncbi:hypothetical protein [Saccharopolyspora griseoalba]|uniref:Uncharacterized protein n=1 Tax=Saccharopolyspora griseoalba TaxID=1431848 RepID=A0ABW2LGZ6_9PSEU